MNRNDYIEDEKENCEMESKREKTLENISYIYLEGKNIRKDKHVEKLWGWYKWWSYGEILRCQES